MSVDRVFVTWVLFGVLLGLNVFDVLTTYQILELGGVELNPILTDNLVYTALVKGAVLLVIFVILRRETIRAWVPVALAITVFFYSVVVFLNITTIVMMT